MTTVENPKQGISRLSMNINNILENKCNFFFQYSKKGLKKRRRDSDNTILKVMTSKLQPLELWPCSSKWQTHTINFLPIVSMCVSCRHFKLNTELREQVPNLHPSWPSGQTSFLCQFPNSCHAALKPLPFSFSGNGVILVQAFYKGTWRGVLSHNSLFPTLKNFQCQR